MIKSREIAPLFSLHCQFFVSRALMRQLETSILYPRTEQDLHDGERSDRSQWQERAIREIDELGNASKTVKRCRSCWRNDIHYNVSIPPFLLGVLLVVTFGLVFLLRPSRCVCCGTMRLS